MLRLKRASAGSGKTYELAKTYIKLLLTTKSGDHPRRLRKEDTISESLKSILAVTFTVKATAEMKDRIVRKLAHIAISDSLEGEDLQKVDYLEELEKDLNTTRFVIAPLARKALRELLIHYSDFKVQTIDSFFQGILHTFAYEASLDDGFNMEIDTDFITSVGLDSTLDELSESALVNKKHNEVSRWLREMMDKEISSRKWNVFNKEPGRDNLYSTLILEAKNLEAESFQGKREAMDHYFRNLDRPFGDIIDEIDRLNVIPFEKKWEEVRKRGEKLDEVLRQLKLTPNDLAGKQGSKLIASIKDFDRENIPYFTRVTPGKGKTEGKEGYSLKGETLKLLKKAIKSGDSYIAAHIIEIDMAFDSWKDAADEYLDLYDEGSLPTWMAYRKMLPKMMMVLEIARQKDLYLQATNSFQISDTNHILSKIIDKDETPFVYERVGTRINHYLLDEFQDTSRLQWENLWPLLKESDSNDHDNLIIGDAKQSIYRFRNADYKLIGEVGENKSPRKFNKIVDYTTEKQPSDAAAQNTNHRSKPRVVEFNNHVFSAIKDWELKGEKIFPDSIREVYRDCVQAIPEKKRRPGKLQGYVEVVFHPSTGNEEKEEFDAVGKTSMAEPGFREIPERILELKERGYEYRDISILVRKKEHGMAVVKTIQDYNAKNATDIPVISEENLKVASSLSVKIIIRALEIALNGSKEKISENNVIPDPIDEEELFRVLRSLNTLSLPSVVNVIIDKFVPEVRRNAEIPFIAAFEDAVLDYCTTHSSDIGSFLKWWKLKSNTLSITSPEETDGVRLLTIHKSKGLENKVVILPLASFIFGAPVKSEWRWVTPSEKVAGHDKLPPYLPVATDRFLEKTLHKDLRDKYIEDSALDNLNNMYVAFTRAKNELYVYMPVSLKGQEKKGGDALKEILTKVDGARENVLLDPSLIESKEREKEGFLVVSYGDKEEKEMILREKKEEEEEKRKEKEKENGGKEEESITLRSLGDSIESPTLVFKEDNRLLRSAIHTGIEEELNPNAEGTLKHRIMQMTEHEEDLDKALREMKVSGLISSEMVKEWGIQLRDAIASVASRRWFAPEMRVINERPIIQKDMNPYRPDRIVVSPEGDAVIIDYKFGEHENRYIKKIKLYASLLSESGAFRSVSAFLWYIPSGEIKAAFNKN